MEYGEIRAGNGTHTGKMLGYCRSCGLYHSSPTAQVCCTRLLNAGSQSAEMIAWRALKVAVAQELESQRASEVAAPIPALIVSGIHTRDDIRNGLLAEQATHFTVPAFSGGMFASAGEAV